MSIAEGMLCLRSLPNVLRCDLGGNNVSEGTAPSSGKASVTKPWNLEVPVRMMTGIRMMSLALGLALVGCGDKDPTEIVTGNCGLFGSANVSVSGDLTASVNKCAYYAVYDGSGDIPAGFGLVLTSATPGNDGHVINFGRASVRPPVGTYNVGGSTEADWNGTLFVNGATDRTFVLTGGTVTITTSNSGNLAGSVNMTGTEATGSGTNEVTITGSFSAKCVDTTENDC